jgi:hypothetical protein
MRTCGKGQALLNGGSAVVVSAHPWSVSHSVGDGLVTII